MTEKERKLLIAIACNTNVILAMIANGSHDITLEQARDLKEQVKYAFDLVEELKADDRQRESIS